MTPQSDRLKEVYRYLNLLRNKPKRVYGFAYLAWLRNGAAGNEPAPGALSVRGAQAVRHRLNEFRLWEVTP